MEILITITDQKEAELFLEYLQTKQEIIFGENVLSLEWKDLHNERTSTVEIKNAVELSFKRPPVLEDLIGLTATVLVQKNQKLKMYPGPY